MHRLFTCFIKRPLTPGRGRSLALHGRKWHLLSSQLVQGAEVVNPSLQQAQSACSVPAPPQWLWPWTDGQRAGQPDSENRKPNLLKIIHGEERK